MLFFFFEISNSLESSLCFINANKEFAEALSPLFFELDLKGFNGSWFHGLFLQSQKFSVEALDFYPEGIVILNSYKYLDICLESKILKYVTVGVCNNIIDGLNCFFSFLCNDSIVLQKFLIYLLNRSFFFGFLSYISRLFLELKERKNIYKFSEIYIKKAFNFSLLKRLKIIYNAIIFKMWHRNKDRRFTWYRKKRSKKFGKTLFRYRKMLQFPFFFCLKVLSISSAFMKISKLRSFFFRFKRLLKMNYRFFFKNKRIRKQIHSVVFNSFLIHGIDFLIFNKNFIIYFYFKLLILSMFFFFFNFFFFFRLLYKFVFVFPFFFISTKKASVFKLKFFHKLFLKIARSFKILKLWKLLPSKFFNYYSQFFWVKSFRFFKFSGLKLSFPEEFFFKKKVLRKKRKFFFFKKKRKKKFKRLKRKVKVSFFRRSCYVKKIK